MSGVLGWIVPVLLWTGITWAGRVFLARFGLIRCRAGDWGTAFLVGFGAWGTLVYLLALVRVPIGAPLLGGVAVAMVAAALVLRRGAPPLAPRDDPPWTRPEGLVGWLLSPSGGVVTHFDRFYLPSIVEVEYSLGEENHVVVNAACTPLDDYDTRLYAVVAIRTRMPIRLLRPLVEPFALRIFAQDKDLLALQTEALHRFDSVAYASTEIDALGPHILKLLRRAERGELGDPSAPPWTREIRMLV